MVLEEGKVGYLAYQDKESEWSKCVMEEDLLQALMELHEIHGDFATQVALSKVVGKYCWPTRSKDINHFCKSNNWNYWNYF